MVVEGGGVETEKSRKELGKRKRKGREDKLDLLRFDSVAKLGASRGEMRGDFRRLSWDETRG